jgi:hypothetical protein
MEAVMTMLDHLHARYFDTKQHTAWVSEAERVAVVPLWNLSGQLTGYHHYRPDMPKDANNHPYDSRYFTRVSNSPVTLWGMESWYNSNTLFVTEGLFDAARLTWNGFSAVCVFSSDVGKATLGWLTLVKQFRPVVAVCDSDAAGKKLGKHGHTAYTVKTGKDFNEADESEVQNFLKDYT